MIHFMFWRLIKPRETRTESVVLDDSDKNRTIQITIENTINLDMEKK